MVMIEKELIEFTGKSGSKYFFKVYSLDEFTTNCAAVYIFTKQIPTTGIVKRFKRLYVGETNNLETVIREHVESPCLKQHGVDSICVRLDKDTDKKSRREIVHDIINGVGGRPPCNDP